MTVPDLRIPCPVLTKNELTPKQTMFLLEICGFLTLIMYLCSAATNLNLIPYVIFGFIIAVIVQLYIQRRKAIRRNPSTPTSPPQP